MLRVLICIFGMAASVSVGFAAKISVIPQSSEQALVMVQGDLIPSDAKQFKEATSFFSKAIVSFQSDGGSALAGIEIGQLIRLKNYTTVVPDGARCASACAIAWLGGGKRFMAPKAQIGFHAAYVYREGQAAETGVGNALVGAYLNKIGLPDRAIVYITQSPPKEMTWLSISDAQQKGIDVTIFAPSSDLNVTTEFKPSSIKPPPTRKTAGMPAARITSGQVVGRWGIASYQNELDRPRTIAQAHAQCLGPPYIIAPGPSGGVMMHLADESAPRELVIKPGNGQRIYIGPAGVAGGEFDREILAFDGQVMITRFLGAEPSRRYGNMVYARCGP